MKKILINAFISIALLVGLFSCNKDAFLDKKPNSNLIVPTTLENFQQLLDNFEMNYAPYLGEASSDNYYLLDYTSWQALPAHERNSFIWGADIFEGLGMQPDWNLPYKQVFTANVVLEGLEKVKPSSANQQQLNNTKGWALFIRGHALFNLAQLFCAPYDASTANTDLGLPVRTKPGVDEPSVRSTIQETYSQILNDLTTSIDLLPSNLQTDFRNRPCRAAALALLARVYLNMHDFLKALEASNASLQLYNTLIDYNAISTTISTPFDRKNAETLFQSQLNGGILFVSSISPNTIVDSTLFSSYSTDDLRKVLYFRQGSTPTIRVRKGSYSGTIYPFGGLATDEVYLIKAECLARSGNVSEAMNTLNLLLEKRWTTGTFNPLGAANEAEALEIILTERRKELVFRGLRWQDLRRLNKEGRNITLTRILNGQTYTLAPNNVRYTLPIPPDEILLSGLQQNPR